MPIRAKVFKTGGSQAVRLPKEFRFEGDEVEISRQGQRVVLEPHIAVLASVRIGANLAWRIIGNDGVALS